MNVKFRLTLMNFMQFFIWGSWLITIGVYWFQNKQWSGSEFGAIFSTMGIASIFMPALMGIIADRHIGLEGGAGAPEPLAALRLRRLAAGGLTDSDHGVDIDIAKRGPHRVERRPAGVLAVAPADPVECGTGGRLRDAAE